MRLFSEPPTSGSRAPPLAQAPHLHGQALKIRFFVRPFIPVVMDRSYLESSGKILFIRSLRKSSPFGGNSEIVGLQLLEKAKGDDNTHPEN